MEPSKGAMDPQKGDPVAVQLMDGIPPHFSEIFLTGDSLPASFRNQSYRLAKDVVHYVCRHELSELAPSKTETVMRSMVDDTLQSRLDVMHTMASRLDIRSREQLQLINNIATNMFDDQLVNWGRVVTLHAFCGYLARYCEEKNILPDCADDVAEILAGIVVNRLGLWIVTNGGWNGFERQFPAMCFWESRGMWKGVLIVGLLLGAVFVFFSSVCVMSNR